MYTPREVAKWCSSQKKQPYEADRTSEKKSHNQGPSLDSYSVFRLIGTNNLKMPMNNIL